MVDTEDVPSARSTPGAPLFGGFKAERSVNGRRSLLKSCRCFSDAWAMEEGSLGTACALPPSQISLARKVGAEFIGRLILIFAGAATGTVNQKTQGSVTLLGLAASTGIAVMIVILSTGHISGAHLNPSMTIAFAALRHFPWKQVRMYIGAQVVASICAHSRGYFIRSWGGGVTVPTGSYGHAFALEFIVTFNLMFVVTAVATDTRAIFKWQVTEIPLLRRLVVHTIYGFLVVVPTPYDRFTKKEGTGASMNPVRTLGPTVAANKYKAIWVYFTAPVLGALGGAGAYTAVKLPEEETQGRPSAVQSLRRDKGIEMLFPL